MCDVANMFYYVLCMLAPGFVGFFQSRDVRESSTCQLSPLKSTKENPPANTTRRCPSFGCSTRQIHNNEHSRRSNHQPRRFHNLLRAPSHQHNGRRRCHPRRHSNGGCRRPRRNRRSGSRHLSWIGCGGVCFDFHDFENEEKEGEC